MFGIFQVPAYCTKITTLANCIRIIFDTQENLNSDKIKILFEYYNKVGWLNFAIRTIESEDLLNLPELKTDDKKTPSQRLRSVLYRLWEKDNQGHEVFENFYIWYMEIIINKIKDKLS